jgi:hypothetical protein
MKHRENRLFGKGVRDLCDAARSWCAKLETLSSTTGSAALPATTASASASVFAAALSRLGIRGWALLLINAIRELVTRLLDQESLHQETLAALSSGRGRRDAACRALHRKLMVYRQIGLSDRRGPVIPPGELARVPDQLATIAAAVRPRLDCPDLHAPFGVRILPSLRPEFDQATAELGAALADVETTHDRSRETLAARSKTMREIRAHLDAARSLHQALCDLRALGLDADQKGAKKCETR